MLRVDVSVGAAEDIDQIADFTTRTWGWQQTSRYLSKLEDGFDLLASSPLIGRTCDWIRPGLRRFEIGKHVVFYLVQSDELLIVRVLHQQMVPDRTHFEQ